MKKIYKRYYKSNQEQHVQRYCEMNNLIYTDLVIHNNYVTFTGYSNLSYEQLVNKLIAERYTIQDELAIQRKHQKGVNNEEFIEYDAYVEDCKVRAKEFIEERNKVISNDN